MVYDIARITVKLILQVLFWIEVKGVDRVPRHGAVLICSNHISNWDPTVLGCFMPRRMAFMAKEELFRRPLLGWLMHSLHAFPIKRGTGDRGAIRVALELLSHGQALVMFPEGTRQKDGSKLIRSLERGIGLLAVRSEAMIQPVIIQGPYRIFHRTRVTFGEPFAITDVLRAPLEQQAIHQGKILVDEATDYIAQRLTSLAAEVVMVHD